jgi:hypothetical protein
VRNEVAVRIVAHRQNIVRYKTLLKTKLTAIEREFIDRRIAEEQAELRHLCASAADGALTPTVAGRRKPLSSRTKSDDCITPG